jgi:hypothetical protein
MGGEAGVIAVTQAADFFLDGRHLKVPTDAVVGHIPGCVYKLAQGLGLKTLKDLNI